MSTYCKESLIQATAAELYRYHTSPGALARLTPPWETIRVEEVDDGVEEGSIRTLHIGPGPLAVRWVAHHENFEQDRQFCDRQVQGPFRSWLHTHSFLDGEPGCLLRDEIEYSAPLGLPLGWLFNKKLEPCFRYRHRQTARDLERIRSYPGPGSPQSGPALRIAITGSTGLVGSALSSFLSVAGHQVVPLQRGLEARGQGALWWPEPDLEALEGLDAVVHLAGEPVAQLWTKAVRERMYFSRVEGTQRLCEALASLQSPPKTLISASAIGYYDTSQAGPIGEDGLAGSDILARICMDWESATRAAEEAGIRVCHLRIGLVLSPQGGALKVQLPAFKLGGGAVLGDGQQLQNIIDRDDVVAAIYHLINRPDLQGAFNGTGPQPVSQAHFAEVLAQLLGRPLFLAVPERALRLLLRDQADMFCRGVAVLPERLLESGFRFQAQSLEDSLTHQLGLA